MFREHHRMCCFLALFLMLFASSEPVVIVGDCSERDLCAFNENREVPSCYCDNRCFVYNDCCKEHMTNNSNDFSVDVSSIPEKCILLIDQKQKALSKRNGAFMIDTCLETTLDCHSNTSDLQSILPVTYDNVTYINAKCAFCNGIDNFKIWSIVFVVHDIDDLVLETGENGSHGNLNRKDTVAQILNPKTESFSHYLLPPDGFIPRYCPFDIWNDITPLHLNEINHQNTVDCRGILFKNEDLCKRDGCCNTSESTCSRIEPFDTSILYGKSVSKSAKTNVFFDFDGTIEDGSAIYKNLSSAISLDFQGLRALILIEFQSRINTTFNYDDCIQSIIAYLRATEFRLTSRYENYIELYTENGNVFIAECVSPLRLQPKQANNLLHYRATVAYMDDSSKDKVFISLKALRLSYLDRLLKVSRKKFRKEKNDFKTSPSLTKLCNNVSLVLIKSHVAPTVEIECSDRKSQSEEYTAGYSPCECPLCRIIYMSVVVVILIEM